MPGTSQSITINTSVDNIWARLKDFHDMSWTPNVITDLVKVGNIGGNEIGAKRVLNGAFHETLQVVDEANHIIKYSIDDGPTPISKDEVSNYIGTVKLSAKDDGTLVEWGSNWDSDAEDGVEFCHGIYIALLDDLKAAF